MSFLERLRRFLDHVARAPRGLPVIGIDLAAHRRHFLAEADAIAPPHSPQDEDARAIADLLPAFVEDVADQILERLLPEAAPGELAELINLAISLQLGSAQTSGSPSRDRELKEIAGTARATLRLDERCDGWRWTARYAFEVRATRRHGDRYLLSPSGAAFLKLPGLDAVRWALALEAAQTLGPMDDWRISPELAAQLLKEPRRRFQLTDWMERQDWVFSFPTIRRLGAMRLLHYDGMNREAGDFRWSYTLFDSARPLLEEIAERRPTPFAVLADALLRDEVAHALDAVHPDPDRAPRESAAAATALQARMVVHEMRNALVPAHMALTRLVRAVEGTAAAEPIQIYRGRMDAGIRRAIAFAEEMLRVANLGLAPAGPFDAVAAVQEAVGGVAGELNGSLRPMLPEGPLSVTGPRDPFVLAIANLLRNAAQAVVGTEGIVEISIQAEEGRIRLRVDDNGPGVAVEHRRAIFEPGVALRPGGIGQGLALVRQVVEGEMHGQVTCTDSPLGGARFEIVLPATGVQIP